MVGFKDLKEGKKYRVRYDGSEYSIENGILYRDGKTSNLSFEDVEYMRFREVIEYVSYDRAEAHMRMGGRCAFHGIQISKQKNISYGMRDGILVNYNTGNNCTFNTIFFNPKWILL